MRCPGRHKPYRNSWLCDTHSLPKTSESPRPSGGRGKPRGPKLRSAQLLLQSGFAGAQGASALRAALGLQSAWQLLQISACAERERQPLPAALVRPEHGQWTVLRAAAATQGNLSLPVDSAPITRHARRKQSWLARDL